VTPSLRRRALVTTQPGFVDTPSLPVLSAVHPVLPLEDWRPRVRQHRVGVACLACARGGCI